MDDVFICNTFAYNKTDDNMDTIAKRPTSLRLREDLLCELKEMAKQSHRSLNNLIEMLLWDSIYNTPNELTISAMRELKTNHSLTAYSSVEELVTSIMEDETA